MAPAPAAPARGHNKVSSWWYTSYWNWTEHTAELRVLSLFRGSNPTTFLFLHLILLQNKSGINIIYILFTMWKKNVYL